MKGVDFIIKIGDKVLGGQRNAALARGANLLDTTSKDSDGWEENEPGLKNWGITGDGLMVENDQAFQELEDAFNSGEQVTVDLMTPGGNKYTGLASIEDFPINAPYTDKATYNIGLKGSGPLVKIAAV